ASMPSREILLVHRAAIDQPEPAFRHAVDEPKPDDHEREPGDEQADAERSHDEDQAERDPQKAPPERANLPAEVRLEPRAARLAPLHVVQDDGDDRGPPREEREHDARGRDDTRDQADRVKAVAHVRPGDQRLIVLSVGVQRGWKYMPPAAEGSAER